SGWRCNRQGCLIAETSPADVARRLAAVRVEIAAAARASARDPARIGIVAVTKTLPPDAVLAALAAGLGDIGENYVQEGRLKRLAIGRRGDRKSTRLNSSHVSISYAVFCLKKKK